MAEVTNYIIPKASENGKFLLTSFYERQKSDDSWIFVYETKNFKKIYGFFAIGEHYEPRLAISNDGHYVATAIWQDYGKGDIFVYKDGKEFYHTRKYNRMDYVLFKDNNHLMVGQNEKTYIIDIVNEDAEVERLNYSEVHNNPYGNEFYIKGRNILCLNGKKIKGSTFAFLDAIAVKDGVVVSEVGNCAILYDEQGNKNWESDTKDYGHITRFSYDENKNELLCYAFNYIEGGSDILIVDVHDGSVKHSHKINGGAECIFSSKYGNYGVSLYGNCYLINGGEFTEVASLPCVVPGGHSRFDYTNLYGTEDYDERVRYSIYVEDEKYFAGEEVVELPDGFLLHIKKYIHQSESEIYARFLRCKLQKNEEVIYEYISIADHCRPFTRFINHSNGHRYYPFHIDLYGISYIDVDTLEVFNYIPRGQTTDMTLNVGESFIISDVHYDPVTNLVAYDGCLWACSYDVMVGDLADPIGFDPHLVSIYEILDSKYEDGYHVGFDSWKPDGIVVELEFDYEKKKEFISMDLLL